MSCRCGCGKKVSYKGILTNLCARNDFTSVDLKKMTKEQLRRLTDPDGRQDKYLSTPKEMKLTDSKVMIYDLEVINLVQEKLRDDEHLYVYVDVGTGGYIFFETPRRLKDI